MRDKQVILLERSVRPSPLGTNWVMVEDGDGIFGQGIDNKSALEQAENTSYWKIESDNQYAVNAVSFVDYSLH